MLAVGLPLSARVFRKRAGTQVEDETLLLALIVDRLSTLVWLKTEDARRGKNRPPSLAERLLHGRADGGGGEAHEAFDTPGAFLAARAKVIREVKQHGS